MQRKAHARWNGDLKFGGGSISTASGTLANAAYSFHTRFEEGKGTNPEELLAAAHAGCFSMALSNQLAQAGLKPESIETECTITLDKKDGAFAITESHLELRDSGAGGVGGGVRQSHSGCQGRVSGVEAVQYEHHAERDFGVTARDAGGLANYGDTAWGMPAARLSSRPAPGRNPAAAWKGLPHMVTYIDPA
jgi:osmotically inducible protein OsmC